MREKKISEMDKEPRLKRGFLKYARLSIGEATRRSQAINAAVSTAEVTRPAITAVLVQPRDGASITAHTKASSAVAETAAPTRSNLPGAGSRLDEHSGDRRPRDFRGADGRVYRLGAARRLADAQPCVLQEPALQPRLLVHLADLLLPHGGDLRPDAISAVRARLQRAPGGGDDDTPGDRADVQRRQQQPSRDRVPVS